MYKIKKNYIINPPDCDKVEQVEMKSQEKRRRAMKVVAKIRSDFETKFGIPRQSGLINELKSMVVFEPRFRNPDALRGLEEYSHIWLIWEFSQSPKDGWSPMVRPPRLGGNVRKGVFATRAPFRPNPIGLSCVRLEKIEDHETLGHVLHISGRT